MKSTNKIFLLIEIFSHYIDAVFFFCLQYCCVSRLSQQQMTHQAWITPGTLNTDKKKTTTYSSFFLSIWKKIFTHPSNVKRILMHTVQLQILFLAIHTASGGMKQLKIINNNFPQASPMIRQVENTKKNNYRSSFSRSSPEKIATIWISPSKLTEKRKKSPHWWREKRYHLFIINFGFFYLF